MTRRYDDELPPPCRDHVAPPPVDGPTACACGRVTRHPAPRPKETTA